MVVPSYTLRDLRAASQPELCLTAYQRRQSGTEVKRKSGLTRSRSAVFSTAPVAS